MAILLWLIKFCGFALPETNAVFTKLGATNIVPRYDKLLNEWKCLKDAEKEFKQIMGLDQDKDIVHCIDCIPPGES